MSTPSHTLSGALSDRFLVREPHHPENGTLLGFWLYLMSDCLIFAALLPPMAYWAAATRQAPPARSCLT